MVESVASGENPASQEVGVTEFFDNQVIADGNKELPKQNTMGFENNYFLKQSEID